jgi:hypothetical protein
MAVNIFEDIVKTSLQAQGYFVMENVSFGLPDGVKIDERYRTTPSDIDLVAIKPRASTEPVLVVNCKGRELNAGEAADAIVCGGKVWEKEAWKHFRELAVDAWATALKHKVFQLTHRDDIQHVTAVTKIVGDNNRWRENEIFKKRMGGKPLKLWDLEHVVRSLQDPNNLPHQSSSVTQMIRLFKAS